jgi:hypothetical protein
MTEPRLASSVLVSALLRRAEQEGGFATVVAKGDPGAGSIMIILAERGRRVRLIERVLGQDGRYAWGESLKAGPNAEEIDKFLEKRRRFDPDLWVVELDTASAERFAAEIAAFD